MLKFFSFITCLLFTTALSAAESVIELRDYDFPLIYHIVSKDEQVSVKSLAYIASDMKANNDPIVNIAMQLTKAWASNKEFTAHDYYDQFIAHIKNRTALVKQASMQYVVNRPQNWSDQHSMVYNFEKKGFDVKLLFGDNRFEKMPNSVRCMGYSDRVICLNPYNPDMIKFIPMDEATGRTIAKLRDKNQIMMRYLLKKDDVYKRATPSQNQPSEVVVIPVLVMVVEMYQTNDAGQPIRRLAYLETKEGIKYNKMNAGKK